MRLPKILATGLLVILFTLPLSSSAFGAVPFGRLNSPSAGRWQIIDVETNQYTGQTLSLAINPITQKPYISYGDGLAADLKLAFPVSSGGDCGPNNTWSCNSLHYANTENFGGFSSIDFDSLGNWGISYAHNSPAAFVGFTGTPASGNTQFWYSVEGLKFATYSGTNFHYSPSGRASFAYSGMYLGHPFINFAQYGTTVTSTCGTVSLWNCEIISQLAPSAVLSTAGLAYVGGTPFIAYRDSAYNQLYLAARIGFGGDCPNNKVAWVCKMVDQSAAVSGSISMVANGGNVAISYYDSNTHRMVVAESQNNWSYHYLEDVGAQSNDNAGIAIGMLHGNYIVAYTDRKNQSNTILKVAYPDPNGNCGPLSTWRCEVVDEGGGTINVGNYLSMAISAAGKVYIAYSNDSHGGVRLASLTMPAPTATPTQVVPHKYLYLPVVKK
jgi:hypothetical protein